MAGFTRYASTDANAPVIDGQNASIITWADAVLVNGYGAKAGAGWTKPFAGTNQGAYRMGSGVQHYLQLNDNSPNSSAVGREARARGFVDMSSVTAGTEPFPTTAQVTDANGPMIRKSALADATARAWKAFADDRSLYLFIKSGDFTGYTAYHFGEYYSLKSNDSYRSVCIGRNVSAAAGPALDATDNLNLLGALSAVLAGHYTPRGWTNDLAGAVQIGKHGNSAHSASLLAGLAHYPNPQDDSLMLSQVWLHQDLGSLCTVLGRLRGFWHLLHPVGAPINDGDTFSGSGPLAGKTFEVIKPVATGDGTYVIETSNTLETN